jgi:ketosteroid isomerase-like protein
VTTQLGLDLAGLIDAIERDDVDYQAALYAPDAQLRVAQPGPDHPCSVYHGQEEIRGWLERLSSRHVAHRLTDLTSTADGISLTDLIRDPAGRHLIYQMTLQIEQGQIASQNAVLIWEDPQAA